ncbi:MAG: hypothetical protein M3N18_13230 [Actinomycetota bacterium]|nr:hypothetical protein [Actinomycetota bacterium]
MSVNANIGAALGAGAHDSPGGLLRKADLALYRAKSRGKAGYEVFDPILDERITS